MRHIMPWLGLYQVQVSRRVEDILPWIEAVAACGAEVWVAGKQAGGEHRVPPEAWTHELQAQLQKEWGGLWEWDVTFHLQFTDLPEVSLTFGVTQFKDGGNHFEIGTLLDFQFRDERHLVEPTAQRILELGRLLYPLTRPWLGDIEHDTPLDYRVARKRRLKHLSWVNFFGPPYVEKYGRDFLLGLPGYKTELLPEGGVFHQLSPTFVAADEAEARGLREEVIAYFRRHGYKVTCNAPYVIPGLTKLAPPEEPLDDGELIYYLDHILPTTLILDDGTRLKHLYIPWRDLNPWQREMTLERLKQALIAEIKRPGRGRIRLEFHQIPPELEQMLVELAGRDNPDFEWVEVEMGEGL